MGDVEKIYVEYDDHQILELEVLTGTGVVWGNARLVTYPDTTSDWKIIHRDSGLNSPRKIRVASPQEYMIGIGTALCALIRR